MSVQAAARGGNNYQISLPSDINKVIGKLNLLLIDIFCKIRAFFTEFLQRSFGIYKNFYKDAAPIAEKFSYDLKIRLYNCTQKLIFNKKEVSFKKSSEQNFKLPKDIAKALGKLNLVIIDLFSNLSAFFKVFLKRIKTITYKGFFKSMQISFLKFSYEKKMRLYCRAKNIKLPIQMQQNLERISRPQKTIESTATSANKKKYIVVALLGVAIIFGYIMYPYLNIVLSNITQGAETVVVTKRFFYIFNKTSVHCSEVTFAIIQGRECPTELFSKSLPINCRGLDACACKILCETM